MNKLKNYIKRNTTIFILGALLLVSLLVSMMVNETVDLKLDKQERDQQYKVLMDLVNDSDAKAKGLNEFLVIWEYDIEYLRDDFPDNYEEFYDYCNIEAWNQEYNQLLEDIKADYISDEDIYGRIKEIVPEEMFHYVSQKYLKAIAILREDLIQ